MRHRVIVAAAAVLVPALLAAQRIPLRIPTSIPQEPRATPGEPQPAAIARQLAYTRSRYWIESAAFASSVNGPGLGAAAGPTARTWSLTGSTTHAEYRTGSALAPTVDLAVAGFGDVNTSPLAPWNTISTLVSVEPGVRYRLKPFGEDFGSFLSRLSPFMDLRGNYMHAFNSYFLLAGASSAQQAIQGESSWGMGGVAGLGTQFFLTPALSLMTEISTVGDRMTVISNGSTPNPVSGNYWLRWNRLSIGLNYNHLSYRELTQRAIP